MSDLTPDEIAEFMDETESTIEELQDTLENVQESVPESDPVTHDEVDDLFGESSVDPETVDARARGVVEHVVNEDCDGDWCNEVRENLGVDTSDAETHEHDSDESDADSGGSDDDGDDGDGPKNVAFEDSL